jgi:riboflavin synthase
MFTGIIEHVGTIAAVDQGGGKWTFSVRTAFGRGDVALGDSIAIDGVCLTAVDVGEGLFRADASLETLGLTTLKEKRAGQRVNVERALRADGRFGGHIVMGHVDGVGTIVDLKPAGDSSRLTVRVPEEISKYIVKKGSVTVDGISLTVNDQSDNRFSVNVIPFTASQTTLAEKAVRDRVNIETDIIGRYIESFLLKGHTKGIDMTFLAEYGYVKGD